ncbi:MAG: uL15 family ribosomal protein [Candidatus Hodarchaeales archaeon]|jgi:large subunit ribosomal protein L15
MTVRRQKKVRKQRGSRVYGYGRISGGHRKSGSRGGVGNAGSKNHHKIGKITDMILSQKGFSSSNPTHSMFINVGEIDEHIEFLIAAEIAEKEGSKIKVDINKLGPVKVLGKGLVTHPFNLHANLITEKAKEKIEAAGGKVIADPTEE